MVLDFLKSYRLPGILAVLFCATSFCNENNKHSSNLAFLITYTGNIKNDSTAIILKWSDISNRLTLVDPTKISINDLNNSNIYQPIIYTNTAGKIDKLAFYVTFCKNEPLRPFELVVSENNKKTNKIIIGNIESDNSFSVTFLNTATEYSNKNNLDNKWSVKIAESIMATYPDPINLDIFKSFDWSYTNGFLINALFELYQKTGDKKYLAYTKKWFSYFIMPDGRIDSSKYELKKYELDEILPGRTLLNLYNESKEEKYKTASDELFSQLENQPRSKEGGFWHKKQYNNQMWLDGVYMADVFYLQYANTFNKKELISDAARQFIYVNKHMCDPKTGLYYHGWDESKNKIWANPVTGTSPEFWGRGIGWYIMALVDGIDYIPTNNAYHDSLVIIFKALASNIAKYQDLNSGLWFQVINKTEEKDNWSETSATAMIAYAFAKGFNRGLLDQSYKVKAIHAFEGIRNKYVYFDTEGKLYLTNTVKIGTLNFKSSDGSYKYYVSVDRRINDFKGIAALLYLRMELEYK